MNAQGQKTPFQGQKNSIFGIFFSENGCFLMLAGPIHLLRGF